MKKRALSGRGGRNVPGILPAGTQEPTPCPLSARHEMQNGGGTS